ncbi:MAG: hypothetical protein V4547_01350 [Bacteroidota bacterium]
MNYIYCESFAPIFFAEYKRSTGEDVVIITINKNVKKYCDLTGIYCTYMERVGLNILTFYKLFIFKNNIKKIIADFKINAKDRFYILDNCVILEGFYFTKLLRNNNATYYYETNEYQELYKNKISLRCFYANANNLFYKLFLGLDLVLIEPNRTPDIGIDKNKFFKKNNIAISPEKKFFNEIRFDIIKEKTINLAKYETMFIDQGTGNNFLKRNRLDDILNVFSKSNHRIVIKEHPRFQNTNLFVEYDKFPVFIPAELLFGNISKNVISLCSNTLISASKIDRLSSISILELFEWKDESYKKELKEYLKKESDNRIIFVQTIEELIQFL